LLVTGATAQALNVPQSGGFLVKQVAKESVVVPLGLKGGDRIGIVEGQQILVGGDILLTVQGITLASLADMAKVLKALESLQPGQDLRVTVLRAEKVVPLTMKWTGW
jgi:serine protease Do